MTEDQAKRYGRQAGVAYDENYHGAGDTIDNLNHDAFLLNARAIAHAVATFSQSTELVDREKDTLVTPSSQKIDIEHIWPSGAPKGAVAI